MREYMVIDILYFKWKVNIRKSAFLIYTTGLKSFITKGYY